MLFGAKSLPAGDGGAVERHAVVRSTFRTGCAGLTYIMRRAQEIRIEIVDDVNFEKDESFRVVLEKPTGGVQLAEAEPSAAGQPLACEVSQEVMIKALMS